MKVTFFVIAAVVLVLSYSAGADEDEASTLRDRIDSLRVVMKYADAIDAAKTLLDVTLKEGAAQEYEANDIRRLIATLELIAALPDEAQEELTEAERLDVLIDGHQEKAEYEDAFEKATQAVEIRIRWLGTQHVEVASAIGTLGSLYYAVGDYPQADSLWREALAIRQSVLDPVHPDIATSLNNLAVYYYAIGEYTKADSVCRQALAMRRELFGNEHRQVAETLNNLAAIFDAQGDYSEAEALYREALDMRRQAFGEEHAEVAEALNNLASVLKERGELDEAEPLFREALAMRRKLLGDEHPRVADVLNNLATVLEDQGDYAAAEPLYREALVMWQRIWGEEHQTVATGLSNLAHLFENQGDFASAEPLYRDALAMQRGILGDSHPSVAVTLNNLGSLLDFKGDHAAAESFYRESLVIVTNLVGDDHPYLAKIRSNLAFALEAQGDYATAGELFSSVLETRRRTLGESHPDFGGSLNNYAGLLHLRGDDARADSLYRHALPVLKSTLGDNHPDVVATLANLGGLRFDLNDYSTAESLFVESAAAYDVARLSAGVGVKRATFQSSPYGRLAATRLLLDKTDEAWLAVEKSLARVLMDVLRAPERRSLAPLETGPQNSLVDLSRIQDALSSETALLGWHDDISGAPDSIVRSWAYVIRDQGPVQWVQLRETIHGDRISEEALAYRGTLISPDPFETFERSAESARRLYESCVAPVESMLAGVDGLVIIPSGAMLGLPVESLLDNRGRYLGDRFHIVYCPSATVYARLVKKTRRGRAGSMQTALMIGDPPFSEAQAEAMSKLGEGVELSQIDAGIAGSIRGGRREALSELPRLHASRREIEVVSELLGDGAEVLLGEDASEQAVVAASEHMSQYDILHFATHAIVDDQRSENSALILSQLNLPDALEAAESGGRIYDGRITVKEILNEWELDAKLVVLSACETALGRKIAGEGYVGFAHAFLECGARNLILSLWAVDDASTALLMERFYRNLLDISPRSEVDRSDVAQAPLARALQSAKRSVREYTDTRGQHPYAHPWYWAGFILIGAGK